MAATLLFNIDYFTYWYAVVVLMYIKVEFILPYHPCHCKLDLNSNNLLYLHLMPNCQRVLRGLIALGIVPCTSIC